MDLVFGCIVHLVAKNRFYPVTFKACQLANGTLETTQGKAICKRIDAHPDGFQSYREAMDCFLGAKFPILERGVTWKGKFLPELLSFHKEMSVVYVNAA